MTKKKLILALIAVGFLVYFNSLFNGFVWDDEEQVVKNPYVHSLSNLPALFSGSTFNTGGGGLSGLYYKPLMSVSFATVYTIFGPQPFFFHLFQLSTHISNSILLFLLFSNFWGLFLSFGLALVFLIHPINNEAVVYISSLQDTLFLFFGLLALKVVSVSYLTARRGVLVFILLLLSLLSKETGILFIPVVFLYRVFFLKDKGFSTLIPSLVAILSTYAVLRFLIAKVFFHKLSTISPIMTATFLERMVTAPKVIFYYLKTFLFPVDLSISQHWLVKDINLTDFYLPLTIDIFFFTTLIVFGIYLFKKSRQDFYIYLFFFSWLIIGLGLHLHLFPLDMTVAERWFYFPFIGLLGTIGVGVNYLLKKVSTERLLLPAMILITFILGFYSLRTIIRNTNWQTGYILYSHDIKISSDSFDLQNNMGTELARQQRYQEAKPYFEKSIALSPNWWTNWNNLGVVAEKAGDLDTAQQYYQRAIENGNYYLGYENMAGLMLSQKKYEETRQFIKNSLKILPFNSKLWLILAIASYQLGEKEAAMQEVHRAYLLSPTPLTYRYYYQINQNLPLSTN